MEPMTSFDADLVRQWFGRLRDREHPVMPHWAIVPTAQEAKVLLEGESLIRAALDDTELPFAVPDRSVTEIPAQLVDRYLRALAAAVASTRHAIAPRDEPDVDDASSGFPTADAGTMALVAGLNAGAAALVGGVGSRAFAAGRDWRAAEPTAAESARKAGVAAADLVVDGADLHEIAEAAAGVAMSGWQIGLPEDRGDQIQYRARGLVGLLLAALEVQTRDPEPPAEPAACGAMPGENLGRPFDAEITFALGLAPAEIRSLSADLAGVASEVTAWPRNQWTQFHVHSDQPGEVVGQVFAYGTPFDLQITARVPAV